MSAPAASTAKITFFRNRWFNAVFAISLGCFAVCVFADPGETSEAGETGASPLDLSAAVKWTGVESFAQRDPLLYSETESAIFLYRARLQLTYAFDAPVRAEFAYEHRGRLASQGSGMGVSAAVLPSMAEAPYRLEQLDWRLAGDDNLECRHEIDRANVTFSPPWGEITAGRQAIGLGRGVLFSAVDVFAPFSPLEVDREWRRGVDAARVEYRFADTASAGLLAAAGSDWDRSAILGRVRGYIGDMDGELILGKRARDFMTAAVVSAAVGDAEVHGEFALFNTPGDLPESGLFGGEDWRAKSVLGASYTFDIGNGLTVLGEYHYSDFGLRDPSNALRRLLDEDYRERYLRGDSQILGRHALGVQCLYLFNEWLTGSCLALLSPVDGSGVLSPGLVWDFNQNASLRCAVFIPWGPGPEGMRLGSEYGATPFTLFAQMSLYF